MRNPIVCNFYIRQHSIFLYGFNFILYFLKIINIITVLRFMNHIP
ncbi:unknown [Prevotella sp. CAG:732]|nr:unknown [Prevotella sp. CAG:732]